MPSRELDFPVFDADNHMYETRDALTKHLPREYEEIIRLRRGRRAHEDHGEGPDQRLHPQPDLRPGRRARRPGGVLQGRQPRGQVAPGDHGQGIRCHPGVPRRRAAASS